MKSFKTFLTEMPWRKIDKLHPRQKFHHSEIDTGWVDYLRRHLKSKKSQEVFKKRNPTFKLTTTTGKQVDVPVRDHKDWWAPIRTTKSHWQWNKEPGDKEDEHDIHDGNHRYFARKLAGKKKIKTES